MDIDAALQRTSRLGAATALGAALAIFALCLVFQFVVPVTGPQMQNHIGADTQSFRALILYATAGGIHLLLCGGSVLFFLDQLRKGEPNFEFTRILIAASIVFLAISAAIITACYLDLNVVGQSYESRLAPLIGDNRLIYMLAKRPIPFLRTNLQLFALFPLALILSGAAAAIMACFWIAHNAIAFVHRADDLKNSDVLELKRKLTELIGLVAVVFTSSAIATIALMQIGRDWISKGDTRDAYIQNGQAMSIFWSACYSTVIVLIIVIPVWWIARRTRRIRRQAKRAGERSSLQDQIFELVSYKSIAQAGLATLAPLFTSSVAAVFGS